MRRWMAVVLAVVWWSSGLGNGFVLPPGAVAAIEPGWAVDIAFSPQGDHIALALREEIQILSGEDLSFITSIPLPEGIRVYSLAFVDGTRLVAGCSGGTVLLLDLSSRVIVGEASPHTGRIWDVAVGPRRGYLATASGDGGVALLSLPDLREVFAVAPQGGGVYSVAFSRNGETLTAGGKDGTIRLYAIPSGKPAGELRGHDGAVWGLAVSPAGRLISAGSDGRAIVWDLPSGTPLRVLFSGAQRVREACARLGGDLIALATSEVEVVLWSEVEEDFIGWLTGHRTSLWTLAFSPDGRYLATASTGGRLILWDMEELLSLRPRIMEVHYSKRMGHMQYIAVSFSDSNGDIASARIELLAGDPTTIRVAPSSVGLKLRRSKAGTQQPLQPRALPAQFLIQGYQGRENGNFTFGLRVDEPQRLVLRIVLADTLGLVSEDAVIEIEATG